jgi:hypothetical protein
LPPPGLLLSIDVPKAAAEDWPGGIAKTVGEYAVGGWERSPSAKQAKWALEAYKTAEQAGAIP